MAKRDRFRMRPRGKEGPLVYAVRDERGRFKDIQKVSRSVKLDLRKVSKEERRKRRKKKGGGR